MSIITYNTVTQLLVIHWRKEKLKERRYAGLFVCRINESKPLIGMMTSVSDHFSNPFSLGWMCSTGVSGRVDIVSLFMFMETIVCRRLISCLFTNETVAPVISVDGAGPLDAVEFLPSLIRSRLLNMTRSEFEYNFANVSATHP